jgi:hypothetical protein
MGEKKLSIKIDKAGNISYTVSGVMGATCKGKDFSFLDDLGKVVKTENTDDYLKQAEESSYLTIGRG